jgi:dihydrofolate synthase/folylpolyglutamate synthase
MVKMPHWPKTLGNEPAEETALRMQAILASIGNPQNKLPPIIHVAGTNGKGSTIAFLRSIFKHANVKAHSYISPHIARFNERILIGDEEISDELLYEVIETVRINLPDNITPTFFEATTAASLLAFSQTPADILIVECGMGGRLDATNIFPETRLAIITSISLDHTEYLGHDIRSITSEKAHIIKENGTAIIAPQAKEAMQTLKLHTNKINANLLCYEENYDFSVEDGEFAYIDIDQEKISQYPLPSLMGDHQIINASLAIAAIKNLAEFKVSDQQIANGLQNTHWSGRLEQITTGELYTLLDDSCELWIDGAHNNAGAFVLANWLKQFNDDKKNIIIFGRTEKRDNYNFLKILKEEIDELIAIKVEGEPKPEKFEILLKTAEELKINSRKADGLPAAINSIKTKKDCRVLICGSLYLQKDLWHHS